jgi:Uma2 family endonuclease
MLHSVNVMSAPMDLPIELPEQRRISVAEYHRMLDVGILTEDDRVELLEGVLIAMPPMGDPHAWSVQELNHLIARALPDGYRVRPQLPVTLGLYSEPQPDLAVVALEGEGRKRKKGHPETALLVIEVSDSSLRYDRNAKAKVYARSGIPEYWIIDVNARCVEVRTDPDEASASYRTVERIDEGGSLQALSVPLPAIPIVKILP